MNDITIIVAMTKDRVIGIDGSIPWYLKKDVQQFRKITKGELHNNVIMGRKTYESILKKVYGPLPGRKNIVISSTMPQSEGIIVCRNLDDALSIPAGPQGTRFVIGGASIYSLALPYATHMIISHVKKDYLGDAYFPDYDLSEWVETECRDFKEFEQVKYMRRPSDSNLMRA